MSRFERITFTHWFWVIPILLLALVMFSVHLQSDAFWSDEASTLRNIGASPYPPRSVDDLVYHIGLSEWPPAYFLALLGWGNLVGWSEFAARTLSMFMGMLTLAISFRLSRTMFNERTSLVVAFLLSTSINFVFYTHELRGYAQYMLLTISSVYIYWGLINRTKRSLAFATAFILSITLLMYTHYLAIFVVVGLGLYHILFARGCTNWKSIFFYFVLAGVAFLPWLGIAFINVAGVSTWKTDETAQLLLTNLINNTSNKLWFFSIPLLIASLVWYRKREGLFLWFIVVLTLGLALASNAVSPFIFNSRHLIGVVPLLIILIGFALTQLPYQTITSGVVIVMWFVSGVWYNSLNPAQLPEGHPAIPIETLHTARDVVNTCTSPSDSIVTLLMYENSGWDEHTVVYYLLDEENTRNVTIVNYMTPIDTSHPPLDTTTSYEERYQQFVGDSSSTWVLVAPYANAKPELTTAGQLLTETYDYCNQVINTPYMQAYLYQSEPDVTCGLPVVTTQILSDCNLNLLENVLEPRE